MLHSATSYFLGPHQFDMCSHELCASNTRSRGALNDRVNAISLSFGVVTVSAPLPLPLAPIPLLLSSGLELVQVLLEPVVALFPEPAVFLYPVGDLLERPRLEPGGAPLCLPAPGDQPGPFEHPEVLGYSGQGHVEGLGQLSHGRRPRRQAGEDRSTRGIGERSERAIQPLCYRRHP